MSLTFVQSLIVVALGFGFAGLLATGYQSLTDRPASFRLIIAGPSIAALAAVPFLAFAAPFIIMREITFGPRFGGRNVEFMMLATAFAGFWSLMSGTVVVMMLRAVAQLLA